MPARFVAEQTSRTNIHEMTNDLRAGLHPLSHLKASPTTSSSSQTAVPSSAVNQRLHTPPRPRSRKNRARDELVDPTSEKATATLIRRVLCPQVGSYGASTPQPLEELLPPLTSSNDVDRQLYALIAIIVKEFIYSWYSKITADQALVNEVLQVIAHCTRALEQRLRLVDAAQLVLDEIPSLVEAHVICMASFFVHYRAYGLLTNVKPIELPSNSLTCLDFHLRRELSTMR